MVSFVNTILEHPKSKETNQNSFTRMGLLRKENQESVVKKFIDCFSILENL